jgi:hypothetical protein
MNHSTAFSRMRRRNVALLAVGGLSLVTLATGTATAAVSDGDEPVSVDTTYVKANDQPITPGDAIAACGANRRQQNEPTSAVDPTAPNIVTSGSNDYCTVEVAGSTWAGFYRSTDGGSSWTDSLLPGYPTDSSPEGLASPLQQSGITNAGDPVQAWDLHGRLYYMGNAFNRVAPQKGAVWVATYNQHASHYVRTVIVARGTPATAGVSNDKTSIEADRGVDSPYDGNVYVAWSVFQGGGTNEVKFARSTDHGATFSSPIRISASSLGNQFADIAVTSDGTVYVTWNGTVGGAATGHDAMLWVKSVDGGKHFTRPRVAADFDGFDAIDRYGNPEAAQIAHERAFQNADGPQSEVEPSSSGNARDCGSGPNACLSGFVFFRHNSEPRITADPKGDPDTVYLVYDATRPSTEVPSTSTYNTAPVAPDGTLMVGQGTVYFTKTTNGGSSWSTPRRLAPTPVGHQFFPDINADGGVLFAVWHDSRNDPGYSVQNPPGDATATDAYGFHLPTVGLDTYGASSTDGGTTWSVIPLSEQSQMPNYEMFADRTVPFHGDYNYVSSVGGFAYGTWTDTREVRPGDDPRYLGGEGFDVWQCRVLNPDGTYGADTCPNAGGLDQDIYGASMTG